MGNLAELMHLPVRARSFRVPNHPGMTWQYFALSASQEQDPKKLTYVLQQLHRALDQADPEGDEVRALHNSHP